MVASSIGFAAFLSILPLLTLVALLYGMVVSDHVVTDNIATLVEILPSGARQLLRTWLTNSLAKHEASGPALILSAVVTLFGARRAGRSLLYGINAASGIEHRRGAVMNQLVAVAVVLVTAILLLSALVSISVMAFIESAMPRVPSGAEQIFKPIFWGSLTLGPAAALMLTYRYVPARPPIPWTWVWPGAFTAVLLWLGATVGFRFYVSRLANYATTYGSLSAVVVFQLWLMLSAFILLFGAKVNAEALRTAGMSTSTPAGAGND